MTKVNCKYLVDGLCQHPKAPLGRRPHPQKCLRFCEMYDGPERPHFVKITTGATQGGTGGCGACGDGAKARIKTVKHDPAEVMQILDEAMKTDLSDDQTKVD